MVGLLREVRKVAGVKKVNIRSGIRFDLTTPEYIAEITKYHIFNTLRIAPEHVNKNVLKLMNKDKGDMAGLEHRAQTKFTFAFTGTLSKPHRGPVPLLEGARALLVQQPDLAGRFQILLVGPYSAAQVDLPARFGLESVVRLVGLVSHREALAHQVNADVNVLIYDGPTDGRSAQMMSSKIFEYIGAGRPILAIAPRDTAAARLVEDLHLGQAVTPGSPVEIAEAMYSLFMDKLVVGTPAERFQSFQWRHLTRQLADVLTSVVAA
jgi:glycosyltransferase involved in cell wall biosynthesis